MPGQEGVGVAILDAVVQKVLEGPAHDPDQQKDPVVERSAGKGAPGRGLQVQRPGGRNPPSP